MNYRKELIDMIEDLVSGKCTVSEFRDKYYMYQLEAIPDNAFSETENAFFSYIREQLDWTDKNPDDESRKYGWKSDNEYVELVKNNLKNFLSNEKRWHEDNENFWKASQ